VPLWGFGAEQTFERLGGNADCFPMNGHEEGECQGLSGVLNAYENTHSQIELGTRTVFAPILQRII
jgi:hypothetical protein